MAKIIIDIDDDKYENIKNHYYFMYETGVMFAIKNGTVLPSNPTNGDMIKALFPKADYKDWAGFEEMEIELRPSIFFNSEFDLDWWNAPYEGGNIEKTI